MAAKSTIMSALLSQTPNAAKIDAEDVGQVNPFSFDQAFLTLLWSNVTAAINNFWAAGYTTVITGSFLDGDTHESLQAFRERLGGDPTIYVVHLRASTSVRDLRRIRRPKPTSKEWRDAVDARHPDRGASLRDAAGDYRYIAVDSTEQQVEETIADIRSAIPEVYGVRS